MKYAIMGAGAVGGYFGARLAADGNEVIFIARGGHKEAMRQNGLKVFSPLGDVAIAAPEVMDDPAEIGLCDVILFCVKLWDVDAAAETIKPLISHDTCVVPLQNGGHGRGPAVGADRRQARHGRGVQALGLHRGARGDPPPRRFRLARLRRAGRRAHLASGMFLFGLPERRAQRRQLAGHRGGHLGEVCLPRALRRGHRLLPDARGPDRGGPGKVDALRGPGARDRRGGAGPRAWPWRTTWRRAPSPSWSPPRPP